MLPAWHLADAEAGVGGDPAVGWRSGIHLPYGACLQHAHGDLWLGHGGVLVSSGAWRSMLAVRWT
jgi:hypothetical protein